MFSGLRGLHDTLIARSVRYFRAREVVKVLQPLHAKELAETPVNQWVQKKAEQAKEIAAVKSGQFAIQDRRSWQYPYIPEALHRLNQPILKNCFDAATEVLTKRGWVSWAKVTEQDIFATYNIETGCAEWQRPQKVFKYWHEGEMYEFKDDFVDLSVTPDHLMLGRFRKPSRYQDRAENSYEYTKVGLVHARKVKEFLEKYKSSVFAFEAPQTAKWEGKFPQSYNAKTRTIRLECKYTTGYAGSGKVYDVDLMDYVRFLGIYTAEGSARGTAQGIDLSPKSKDPHYVQAIAAAADLEMVPTGHGYGVRVTQTKGSQHREKIAKLMKRLPFGFEEEGENDFGTNNKTLHSHLFPLGNSYTKRIPRWLKNLPSEYLREFIKWACMGDGTVREDSGRQYYTVSKQLADDMQELFQRSGTSAAIRVVTQSGKGFAKASRQAPLYWVSERLREWSGLPDPVSVSYEGYVYCVAIKNQTVYVRRGGKAIWCGRTPYNLRRFSETPIPRRAVNLIKNALLGLKWKVSIDSENYDDEDPELLKKVKIAEDCLQKPNLQDSYRTLFEAVIEDFLMGGYGCIEPGLTPDYRRPIKLWAVDGSTIRIYADWTESTQDRPHYAQLTGLKGERGIIAFLDDELCYIRDNVRSSTPFGIGKMETCFLTINALLGAQDMSARAAADQIHKTWLWWTTNLPPGQFETVQRHIQNEAEGQAKVSMSTGMPKPEVIEVNPVTPEDLLMDWQDLCIRIIAAGFDLSPQSLGLERDVNRSTAQVMSALDFNSAIVPAARKFEEAITRFILHRTLHWKELKFEYIGLDDPDETVQAKLVQQLYTVNSITPDEIRERMQLGAPLPGGWGKLTNVQTQVILASLTGKSAAGGAGAGMGMGGGMGGGGMGGGFGSTGNAGPSLGASIDRKQRTPQIVASLDDSPFSAEDLADMDPQDLEQFRQAGVIPYDPQELQQQMEQQSPGILQTLSEELQEYFEWLEQEEEAAKPKPAKISGKDQKEQQKKFSDREKRMNEVEKAQRTSDKFTTGYESRNYRGPFPKRPALKQPPGLGKKRKTPPNFTGRTR